MDWDPELVHASTPVTLYHIIYSAKFSRGLNFRGLAILYESCSLFRIICYNVQRLKAWVLVQAVNPQHLSSKIHL